MVPIITAVIIFTISKVKTTYLLLHVLFIFLSVYKMFKRRLYRSRAPPPSQLHGNYLLAWFDVGVDVFEHWFEHGIVAHTQVLDLDLPVLGPVLRHLRGVWRGRNTGGSVTLTSPLPLN